MFIKSITLENYYSFKERQMISFSEKNIIVGKNGSGKSNLISTIFSVFLADSHSLLGSPHFNKNEDDSIVSIEIDNRERRFPLAETFVLKMVYKASPQYFIDDRPVSTEELAGLTENSGFHEYNFIFQGFKAIYDSFGLISKVAGVKKFEENKLLALKYLNENGIEEMQERLEYKSAKYTEFSRKLEKFNTLQAVKKQIEFDLAKHKIQELNEQIGELGEGDMSDEAERKPEEIIELEIAEHRENIYKKRQQLEDIERFLKRVDKSVIGSLTATPASENKSNTVQNGALPSSQFVNVYDKKIESIEALKREKESEMDQIKESIDQTSIELKALKYFELNGKNVEEVDKLERLKAQKKLEIANFKIASKNLEKLISDRKSLWIHEKRISESLQELKKTEKMFNEKMLYLGRQDFNIYEAIKDKDGVIGTVFSTFDIPEEMVCAFEAVCKASLFYIIVENEEISLNCIKSSKGVATYIPLNKIRQAHTETLKHLGLSKLSECIPTEKYRKVLDFVCRNFYICDGLEKAISLSKKHRINVVTLSGDMVSYNGMVTGGYEQSSSILRETKQIKNDIKKESEKLECIKNEVLEVSRAIDLYSLEDEDDEKANLVSLKAIHSYLEMKIEFMKNKKISVREIANVERDMQRYQNNLQQASTELNEIKSLLSEKMLKKEKADQIIGFIREKNAKESELKELEKIVQNLEASLLAGEREVTFDDTHKQFLIESRSSIMKQYGIYSFSNTGAVKDSRSACLSKLKKIIVELKEYSMFDSENKALNFKGWDRMLDIEKVKRELKRMKDDKNQIIEFIDELEMRKAEAINAAFGAVSSHYSYFYKSITGNDSSMILDMENSRIDLAINGVLTDIDVLSGGQKTIVSMCLIFAIQKMDPSPFYVFDEIDASLDPNYCSRIYGLIRESEAQFFITSFKEESLECGDRFFGVVSQNQSSFVGEICKELAQQTLKNAME